MVILYQNGFYLNETSVKHLSNIVRSGEVPSDPVHGPFIQTLFLCLEIVDGVWLFPETNHTCAWEMDDWETGEHCSYDTPQ